MSVLSIGDLASTFMARHRSTALKTALTRLGNEVVSGQKEDLGKALAGDFGPLAAIERSLTSIGAYTTANTETSGMLAAAQLALGNVQGMSQKLGPASLAAGNARDVTLIATTSEDARQKFSAVVSTLNIRVADRTLFAGAATDHAALADGEEMLEALTAAVAGETTAAGIASVVEDWFQTPGGGFETLGYLGSSSDLGPLLIAEDEALGFSFRADQAELRVTLESFALAALIAEGAPLNNAPEQAELMSLAAEKMLTNDGDITKMRARLGAAEARAEDARARNAAEMSAYQLARADLIGVDPYEAATELEAVYAQIETLYTVTARIAGLSFADYMR